MNVSMNTVKNILLPLGVIWTVSPIAVVGMILLTERYGGAAILIMLFILGLLCLFALLAIALWEKAKAKAALERAEKALEPIKLPPRP